MKKRKNNEQTLGEALKLMFSEYRMDDKITATKVEILWGDVMGVMVAKYTEKVYVKNKVLHVKLSSAELKNELRYGKTRIINHINEELGEVYLVDVKFV
jgi:hypothetical protein